MAHLAVRKTVKGNGLFALQAFKKNDKILSFERTFVRIPTNKTMRITAVLHQASRDPSAFENQINHSCNPNGYIYFSDLSFRAKRKISRGEELIYNYFTTDWDSEDVFHCKCGSKNCLGLIGGFKRLPLKEKLELRSFLSPFLRKKLEESDN